MPDCAFILARLKFAAIQMIDVHIPTSDGRELMLTRYTEPQTELKLLLHKLRLELPAQPPPKITAVPRMTPCIVLQQAWMPSEPGLPEFRTIEWPKVGLI